MRVGGAALKADDGAPRPKTGAAATQILKEAKDAGFPTPEKVKAHDEDPLKLGVPKTVGNTEADRQAKQAVKEQTGPEWQGETAEYGDPMELSAK